MSPEARLAAFRALAATLQGVDLPVYTEAGRDPLDPIFGNGDPASRLAIFGRDPGRHEVLLGEPFIGVGGQKIRAGLHRAWHGVELPDLAASIEIGRRVFWANTVPYKPVGNVVWPRKVRAAFAPLVRDLLVHGWHGEHVLALGNEAIAWFADAPEEQARVRLHLARPDRYETSFDVVLTALDGARRRVQVHPLPHPSPLNATWAPHIARLLGARLEALGWGAASWRVAEHGGPSASV